MLKRLVVLNSNIYSRADINFNNCNSIQIVGPNNIGKSTLIYALNFLFILDKNEMSFSGNRKGDKATFNHYFPDVNTSYVIFEIFKNRYYSILVKRNAEGGLDYYKIDSHYDESFYFETIDNQRQGLRNFKQLQSELITRGAVYEKFKNKKSVFNSIYQKGRRGNALIWLKDNQDGREISNNFSKIYRYLINAKLINNDSLKESLIIADNRDKDQVSFSKKSQRDIQDIRRHNKQIRNISCIKDEFNQFKQLVDSCVVNYQKLSKLMYAFNQKYLQEHTDIKQSIALTIQKQQTQEQYRDKKLNTKIEQLNNQEGELREKIKHKQEEIDEIEQSIAKIKQYEPESLLKSSSANLNQKRKTIESSITQIEQQDLNSLTIENHIKDNQNKILTLDKQIKDYASQLIHGITENQQHKELLNRIFSDEISSLSIKNIKKTITQVNDLMNIFDGVIELPNNIIGKPIASIEELEKKLESLKKTKQHNEILLSTAKNLEQYQQELRTINEKINTIQNQLQEIAQLPKKQETLKALKSEFQALSDTKEKIPGQIKEIQQKIKIYNTNINQLVRDIETKKNRLNQIQDQKSELEQLELSISDYHSEEPLDTIYINIKNLLKITEDIKQKKYGLFAKLKRETERLNADETTFIKEIDDEISALNHKQEAVNKLLQNISTQFAVPCKRLSDSLDEFKKFISRFNQKIKQIQISDIDQLKIEVVPNEKLKKDLANISEIENLTAQLAYDQSENLETLNQYLKKETTIIFSELFDIKLHLYKNAQHRVVDLKYQIESDGTDKIIRLVIMLSIINEVIIQDDENKLVIFIDEMGTVDETNRTAVLRFCKENHFVPISAALNGYYGFDKYYFVPRSTSKVNISDHSIVLLNQLPRHDEKG